MPLAILASFLLAQAGPVSLAADPGEPDARDMYIACLLYVNDIDVPPDAQGHMPLYGARLCAIESLPEVTTRDGHPILNREAFCMPHTPEIDANPRRAMALAYIEHYRAAFRGQPWWKATLVYLTTMMTKWPCHRAN